MKYDFISVTLNPALDRVVHINDFRCGQFFDTENQKRNKLVPGGKGINISMMLSELKMTSLNMGFLGGFIGNEIMNFLGSIPEITTNFVLVEEDTRVNIRIIDQVTNNTTTILSKGPEIEEEDYMYFFKRYEECLPLSKNVIVSGSLPPGVPENTYSLLFEKARKNGLRTFMEGIGPHFELAIIENCPEVVKVDLKKNKKVFDLNSIETVQDCVKTMNHIINCGAKLAIMNIEKNSFIIAEKDSGIWILQNPSLDSFAYSVNDALMSGILYALNHGKNHFDAARYGVAAAVSKMSYIDKKIAANDVISKNLDSIECTKIDLGG